jgi:hypothetical protein
VLQEEAGKDTSKKEALPHRAFELNALELETNP